MVPTSRRLIVDQSPGSFVPTRNYSSDKENGLTAGKELPEEDVMSRRCAWTSVGRPTEPPHVSAATATESQPEVWMRRDDSSLPGSRVNGSQPGNVIRLAQWPIEEHQQRHPTPSTPRRSSLDSAHCSTAAGAARVIPLTRWPLSDPRGGRTAIFNAGGTPRRTACTGNRYVSDPCAGRQSSDLKLFTRNYDNRDDATDVRVLKTNLFSVEGTDWSEEDGICVLSDKDRESVKTTLCPSAKSMALLKDIDRFGTSQYPLKDHMGNSSVNQCPSNVIDSTEAHHQRSLKCADLSGEPYPLTDTDCTSRAEHRSCLQGKRGGEKCARLMSRLCRRQKRSKQHDTTL